MNRNYNDRESFGPEFDDRLIKLVRANPAIYDVSHPNYRRNPVRVAIWERISKELGATSRFLQTKWKNIRYNYLQEIKSIETGQPNANIRRRRFTEDLSFLQNTAQTYNVKKAASNNYKYASYTSSDNDSNSYVYPDPETTTTTTSKMDATAAYEVIEIEHSDDEHSVKDYCNEKEQDYYEKEKDYCNETQDDCNDNQLMMPELLVTLVKPNAPDATDGTNITPKSAHNKRNNNNHNSNSNKQSPTHSYRTNSNSSPPPMALAPLVVLGDGGGGNDAYDDVDDDDVEAQIIGNGKTSTSTTNGEITIEKISKTQKRTLTDSELILSAAKRRTLPNACPPLAPLSDPIEMYCLSVADCLRSMPRSERERVKFEFANILKDAKYKDQA